MTKRTEPKPKLTDEEQHKRFVDMAHEVEAPQKAEDFEDAFKKVVSTKKPSPKHP